MRNREYAQKPQREMRENSQEFQELTDPGERVMIEFGIAELMREVEMKGIQTLVFMDKGARPLSWGFLEAFTKAFPQKKRPAIHFLNPPRNLPSDTAIEQDPIVQNQLADGLQEPLLLVDELRYSGNTYSHAEYLTRAAGYTGTIDTFDTLRIWPSWYGDDEKKGVRDKSPYGNSNSQSQFFAARGNATKSRALRQDMKKLGQRIARDYQYIQQQFESYNYKDLIEVLDTYFPSMRFNTLIDEKHFVFPKQILQQITKLKDREFAAVGIPLYIAFLRYDLQMETDDPRLQIDNAAFDPTMNTAYNPFATRVEHILERFV